jgi:hypothetical protein
MPLDTIMDVLSTSPDRLVTLSDGLTPEQLLTEPEPGEWCARDVLAHILACQETWGGCAGRLLQEDERCQHSGEAGHGELRTVIDTIREGEVEVWSGLGPCARNPAFDPGGWTA